MLRYLLAALLLLSPVVVTAGEPDKALHEKCIYPTVMIFCQETGQSGTGVIIKSEKVKEGEWRNLVASVAHTIKPLMFIKVADDQKSATVRAEYRCKVKLGTYKNWSELVSAEDFTGKILAIDYPKDIAVISFTTKTQCSTVEMDFEPKLYLGNEVFRMGCGLGGTFRLDYGRITAVKESIGEISGTYRTSIQTIQGDSGGPVYHENKLIGVAQAIKSVQIYGGEVPICHISYVIPLSRFKDCKEIYESITTGKAHELPGEVTQVITDPRFIAGLSRQQATQP